MNKLLLIVDPQVDFISGTLPVPQASVAMDELCKYIVDNDGVYTYKIVTSDWHPFNHCSFAENGGLWPAHCVQHSVGAALYPPLIAPLHTTAGPVEVLHKGDSANVEEYSVFKNEAMALHIKKIVDTHRIEQIDICGIAGDICVLDTLKDGIELFGKSMFCVLPQFSPSLDGGAALNEYINSHLQ